MFKQKYNMKKNPKFYTTLFIAMLFVMTSIISIGYGALNQNLSIAGELEFEKRKVRAYNLSYDNSTSGLPADNVQEALGILQILGRTISFRLTYTPPSGVPTTTTYTCMGGTTWKEFIEDTNLNTNGYFQDYDDGFEVTYNPTQSETTRGYVWYYDGYSSNYVLPDDRFSTSIAWCDQAIFERDYYVYAGNYCCFEPNTLVTIDLDGHTKRIKDIEVGDQIVVENIKTKEKIITTVVKDASEHPITYDMTVLTFENGTTLKFNSYHPILTTKGYRSITKYNDYERLEIGDIAIDSNNHKLKITNIDRYLAKTPEMTYNLLIKGINENFLEEEYAYIANGVLVHTGIAEYDDEDEWRDKYRHECKYEKLYKNFDYDRASDKEVIKFLVNLYSTNKAAEKEYIKYYITADQYFRYTEFAREVKNKIKHI